MQLKADRTELIAAAKDSLNHDKQLKKQVAALAGLLPPTSHLGYDSENMKPLRTIIDGITDHILLHYPPAQKAYFAFLSRLNKRDDEIRDSCRKQKIKNVGVFLVKDKITADLYRRIGNQVIGFALNVRQRRDKDNQARISNAPLSKRRAERRGFLSSLRDCLKLKLIAEEECMRDFEDYLRRLEEATPEPQYEREHEDKLLIACQYWRKYRTYLHIAVTFGITKSSVQRIIIWVEDTLQKSGRFNLPGKKATIPHINRKNTVISVNVFALRFNLIAGIHNFELAY